MHRTQRPRRGATLIELLVALLLLDLALLSLAGMSALAVKRVGEAGRRARSVVAATNRLERLSFGACVGTSGMSAPERGVREWWSAAPEGSIMDVTDSIEISSRGTERIVLRSRSLC